VVFVFHEAHFAPTTDPLSLRSEIISPYYLVVYPRSNSNSWPLPSVSKVRNLNSGCSAIVGLFVKVYAGTSRDTVGELDEAFG
jgi:hypothetical protein